jgi:hypothetical protein
MIATKLKEIHALVGESLSLWNQVEELWYLIFTGLMPGTDRAVIDAVFNMFQTGSMQRQLITTVAPVSLKFDIQKLRERDAENHARRRLLKRIGQLNARTNDLAGKRNAITHSIFQIFDATPAPFLTGLGQTQLSKLKAADNKTYLQHLSQEITILVIDLADLRDDFIEHSDPGYREMMQSIAQRGGFLTREAERKILRAELHEAVQKREPLPPIASAE